eukprot:EG_transcript_11087
MLGLRKPDNRRCYGCGNRLKEEGVSLLMSSQETEHCFRCAGHITRRGVIGHLIREKRELQQAYASLQAFNVQLQCALNRKKEALAKSEEEVEAFKVLRTSAVSVGCNTDPELAVQPENSGVSREPGPATAEEYVERLLETSAAPSAARVRPSSVSAVPGYGYTPKNPYGTPLASPDAASSPDTRTKMWLEETAAGPVPPRSALFPGGNRGSEKRASLAPPEVPPSPEPEASWLRAESDRPGEPLPPGDFAASRTPSSLAEGPPAPRPPPRALQKASDLVNEYLAAAGARQSAAARGDGDPGGPGSPTARSASAHGTNFTAFTQMSGLESRASMSDRGSEHSYTSSRAASSTLSHPMQTLRQSRNVRSAIADDISYVDELIKAYKKTPKKDPKEAAAAPPPAPG